MNFSRALEYLKNGETLSRYAWNKTDKFIFLTSSVKFKVDHSAMVERYASGTEITYAAHLDLNVGNDSVEQWSSSTRDLLADDWYIFNDQNDQKAA